MRLLRLLHGEAEAAFAVWRGGCVAGYGLERVFGIGNGAIG